MYFYNTKQQCGFREKLSSAFILTFISIESLDIDCKRPYELCELRKTVFMFTFTKMATARIVEVTHDRFNI
jgi:hypothetical protein